MSIRARLTVWYGAAFLATIAVAGFIVWFQVRRDLRQSLEDALRVHATDVADTLDQDETGAIDVRDPGRPGIFTLVVSRDGALVRSTPDAPRLAAAPSLGVSEMHAPDGDYALFAVAAGSGDRVITGTTLAEMDRATDSLTGGLLLVGALAGLVAIGGGWWLAGRALAPVGELVTQLEAIDADDLGRRVGQPPRLDELGRLGRSINAMLGRLDDGMQRQQAFVAAASHDLRTPLAALRTELELAERGPAEPGALLASIRAAHGDAVRLGHLANDVLTLAEAEPGGRPLSRAPVNPYDLLSHCARDFTAAVAGKSLDLRIDAPRRGVVNVDRSRIEQAVRNLLANAVRFAPPASVVDVRATVAPAPAGHGRLARDWLEVAVTDHGPGVADDVRPQLFLPFARSTGGGGGSGLGLATAAAAVRAHGGEVGHRDPDEGGAEFWFRVPA